MAVTNGYVSLTDLKEAVGDDNDVDNSRYEAAIESASRTIDLWCDPRGSRHFWTVDTPVARRFYAFNRWLVRPGFFSTTVGLIVKTDDNGDGTFETTWLTSDWQAQPGFRGNGESFDRIVAPGTKGFPLNGRRECIEITAKWGWAEVPTLVRQAAQILAVALYKSKDFTGGDIGFQTLENVGGWSIYDLARALVEPYQLNPTPRRATA